MASFLKLSEAVSIGLHAACLLGKEPQLVLTAEEIAASLEVSAAHLSKIMSRLKRAGLIKSILGPGGGFALARAATDITLFDVLEGLEGPVDCTACLFSPARCDGGGCVIGGISAEVNELVRHRMQSYSLADVIRDDTILTIKELRPAPSQGKPGPAGRKQSRRVGR